LDHFSALLDADLADEIMVKSTAASTFINGIVAEIRQSGGRRNSILTLKADYALSTYDIVQSLIGIVASRRYRNSAERSDIGEINDIRESVGNIYGDIEHHLVVPLTLSDTLNDLFGICLTQMFPLLVIDYNRVKVVDPLIWSFLRRWNL
jgi:hypothetical protein